MLGLTVLFVVTVTIIAEDGEHMSRIVDTAQGPVRGYKDGDIFVFYGIPYATTPVGVNKYKAPLPPPQWTKPFEAINKNIICPHKHYYFNKEHKIESEDCLIANVYVPDTEEINLPVVVYIHGGAYHEGYGDVMTAKQLMAKKNMIVINFNYRLGVHGFLCLGTKDAPGNAGMKDQVALLRWVKKNIEGFSGNPNDVTLIGYSAGSSAVDLLLLSPMAKGLFNKVIPESGASMCSFSVQGDPIENAWKYAKILNFTNEERDIYALENFYKTSQFETMLSVDVMSQIDSTFFFSPCVEKELGEERFLEDAPLNLFKNGHNQKVPMLFGFTEMEGLLRIPYFENWKKRMNKKFSDFLPGDLKFSNEEERELVAEKVKTFYFGDGPVSGDTILRYVDYFTDTMFAYGIHWSVKLQIESGNKEIYLYQYTYVDDKTAVIPHTQIRGASHCAQTNAIGDGIQLTNSAPEEINSKNMRDRMRELWINFILTGKPVPDGSTLPKWPSAGSNGGPHMTLDKTMKLRGPPLQQRMLFWDSIYKKFYRVPVPPVLSLK